MADNLLKSKLLTKFAPASLKPRSIDIELTNACTISCIFCPRYCSTPQSFMSFDTFKKAIDRACELKNLDIIHLCGLGEPLLHPQAVMMVEYLAGKHLDFNISTNATLLTSQLAENLIAAGLKTITFSVSGTGETYEEIHRSDYVKTKNNILNFIRLSGGRCKLQMAITVMDMNEEDVSGIERIWEPEGIQQFFTFKYNNRGGVIDKGYYFTKSDKYIKEAEQILKENNLPVDCSGPFVSVFIGWNGIYYLCCNDYQKSASFGNVYDNSIDEIDKYKRNYLDNGAELCKNCDTNIVNIIRELLFRINNNSANWSELETKIEQFQKLSCQC